ncbi:unnamed protein product, partial [marine sediment metagenome]
MTHIATHLSNPFHPYTERELCDAFDNDIPAGGNPQGVKISAYNKMPKVKEAILLNVKLSLEKAGVRSQMVAGALGDEDGVLTVKQSKKLPGTPETLGTTLANFNKTATLKNPNPPIDAVTGENSGWENEYYIFQWNDGAAAMKVERYIN